MTTKSKKKNYSKVDLKQVIEKILEHKATANVIILGQNCKIVSISDRIDNGYIVGFKTISDNRIFTLSDIQLIHTDLFDQIDNSYNGYTIIDIIHKYIKMIVNPKYTDNKNCYTEEDFCVKIFDHNFFATKTTNKNPDDFIVQFQCNSQHMTISMTLDDIKTTDIIKQIELLLYTYDSKNTTPMIAEIDVFGHEEYFNHK